MSCSRERDDPTEEAARSASTPSRPAKRLRCRVALWILLLIVLLAGATLIGLVHRSRQLQQQTVDEEINNVLNKWGMSWNAPLAWENIPPEFKDITRDIEANIREEREALAVRIRKDDPIFWTCIPCISPTIFASD